MSKRDGLTTSLQITTSRTKITHIYGYRFQYYVTLIALQISYCFQDSEYVVLR